MKEEVRNEVAFVTTTRCHLKEIGHKTEDRRTLSPNTSHIVTLDHKGKGHHDQDHKDKGWYDPVKAPFQECQVVDSLLARKFIDQERCNQKSWEGEENIYPNKASRKGFLEEMVKQYQ